MAFETAALTLRQEPDVPPPRDQGHVGAALVVADGQVSPVALAERCLERLETLGPRYNAIVTLTRGRVRSILIPTGRVLEAML